MKKSTSEKVFQVFNLIVMLLIMATIIVPIMNIISVSFSETSAVNSNSVGLFPVGFQTRAYEKILTDSVFLRALFNTVFVTVVGTFSSVIIITLAAYGLSKNFFGKKFFTYYFVVTMYFTGGLVPTYLVVSKYLGMRDTLLAYFLPYLVNIFYLIVLRTQIETLPASLMEAAHVDGASEYQTLFRIVLPLLTPTIAAVSMFIALNKWNMWYPVLLYSSTKETWTLQYFLRAMVFDQTLAAMSNPDYGSDPSSLTSPLNFQNASIVLVAAPIVCIYPFVQKYFVKGIIAGAVKG